ncbi:hypothetical protein [Streptomyces sp. NPDC051994]|uniref:hypothetical protein n=1 Tax=unclassified Streptomyces TaxID=2593676 RepID=UPI00343823CA
MSALTDRLHALISRFATIGKADVEEVVAAAESHLLPVIEQARAEIVADLGHLIAEAKVDEQKLAAAVAAEVAKLLNHPAAPAAPVEPTAPQA